MINIVVLIYSKKGSTLQLAEEVCRGIDSVNEVKARLRRVDELKQTRQQRMLEKYEKVQDNIFATVKFVSDIISVKKDKENNVLEGNPDRIKTVTDHWKFSKKVTSNSPNWYLAEILPK